MATYSIYEGHMKDLMKKVTRIKNKCNKFGCDFRFEEVGEEFKEVATNKKDKDGKPITEICRFVIVEAEGTAIVNNWELVSSVEHTEKGNIYSKVLTDVEIPVRYRTTGCICEHCNTNRERKYLYIIRNTETGEFKQVGRSCLMDFTQGMSVAVASEMASLRDVFEEAQAAPIDGCGYGERYVSKDEMLRLAAETIRHFGYAKSESRRSTRDRVSDYYNVDRVVCRHESEKAWIKKIREEMAEVGFDANSEEAKEMADKALAWISKQEATNDYMHNLKVVTSLEYIGWSKLGILVSLFPTYNRELEREAQRKLREEERQKELEQGKNSQFVGEVGKKLTAEIISCKCVTSWTNNYGYNGYYEQTTYMYKFVTADENILIWKTSKNIDEDKVQSITGTVKEHNEFRDVKQTVLTRCKVTAKAVTKAPAKYDNSAEKALDEFIRWCEA